MTMSRENPRMMMNRCSEIHGACRHNPAFHRHTEQKNSTDEPIGNERVNDELSMGPDSQEMLAMASSAEKEKPLLVIEV